MSFESATPFFSKNELFSSLKVDQIASKELIKQAREGSAKASYVIGVRYNAAKNYSRAFSWFYIAAERNFSQAQNQIGYAYQRGLGVTVNHKLAMDWYLKAANNGDDQARNNLGHVFEKGLGVPVNYRLAMDWYLIAATNGNSAAQHQVGSMYEKGRCGSVDYKLAMEWYHKSASTGNNVAQYKLGAMYEKGLCGFVDYKLAMEWYKKSSAQRNITAIKSIGRLIKKMEGQQGNSNKRTLSQIASTDTSDKPNKKRVTSGPSEVLPLEKANTLLTQSNNDLKKFLLEKINALEQTFNNKLDEYQQRQEENDGKIKELEKALKDYISREFKENNTQKADRIIELEEKNAHQANRIRELEAMITASTKKNRFLNQYQIEDENKEKHSSCQYQ